MAGISEKQPLLEDTQQVPVARRRDRLHAHAFAFRRTLLLIILFLLVVGGPVVHRRNRFKTHADVERYFLKKGPNASSAQSISRSLTSFSHIAGTDGDLKTVSILRRQWERALGVEHSDVIFESGSHESQSAFDLGKTGPSVHVDTYYSLLNYPLGNSTLSLVDESGETVFNASLKEKSFEGHEESDVPVFHGFSKAGQAEGRLVYGNYGTREDFQRLEKEGIDLKGAILIVKYGHIFRGLKVGQAEDAGAAGVLIYSDPGDDGEMTIENGYQAYPDGPARQPSSVQRGSVQFLSLYPGDPLTPGKPSYKNATRLDPESTGLSKPRIPSIPISYEDALPLLASLNGQGLQIPEWQGGLTSKGIDYFTGPSNSTVRMNNQIEETIKPIWNAYAIVPGSSAEEEIVFLGNHRDAWDKGASDPISGTTAMTQVIQGVGKLWNKGWRPRRTIVFASWDAEEYGLIGSTEFGEDFARMIQERVMLYLNVDVATAGSIFKFASSPSLIELFRDVTARVPAPDEEDKTVADYMKGQQRQLGSGSDYTVFLQHLGIAAADVGFTFSSKDPVYHYHSMYDSERWIERYGDPGFKRNVAIARIMGLAAVRASTDLVIPLNMLDYSHELSNNVEKIKHLALDTVPSKGSFDHLNITHLQAAVSEVHQAATNLAKQTHALEAEDLIASLNKDKHSRRETEAKAKALNQKLKGFELAFIDEDGLPNRSWYKHLGIAPGRWLGYGGTTFPGLSEAIELDTDGDLAEQELKRLTAAIRRASKALRG